uniref:Uncharacterized protein n=1 Tax=Salarias fasciatus TaxID=181472 RepID=A0A672HR31_SALFA
MLYIQANGEAERTVATVKGLWKGKGDKAAALQTYRATPLESGYSPGQLLMGRQIRSGVPQVPAALQNQNQNQNQFIVIAQCATKFQAASVYI